MPVTQDEQAASTPSLPCTTQFEHLAGIDVTFLRLIQKNNINR